jgi:hypothetical protein
MAWHRHRWGTWYLRWEYSGLQYRTCEICGKTKSRIM